MMVIKSSLIFLSYILTFDRGFSIKFQTKKIYIYFFNKKIALECFNSFFSLDSILQDLF